MSITKKELDLFQQNHPKQYKIQSAIIALSIIFMFYLGFCTWNIKNLFIFCIFVVIFKFLSDRYIKFMNQRYYAETDYVDEGYFEYLM